MKPVKLYGRVRYTVRIEGISGREATQRFGIDPRTVAKMLAFSVPPGYRRGRPPARPKLDPFVGIIDRILEEDKARPAKQRHTSKRSFERLRDKYGCSGGVTIVKDYVLARRQHQREMLSCNRITCLPIGSDGPARATTRARWKGWSGFLGLVPLPLPHAASFAPLNEQFWRIAAVWATGCAAMRRPSARGWHGTRLASMTCRRCLTTRATSSRVG
jgi:hypothetical protein